MNKYTVVTILIILVLLVLAFFKKSRIIDNKEIAVGVIIKSSCSDIKYEFIAKGLKYIGNRGANFVNPDYVGKKYLVVYNSLEPDNNFMMLNYPLSYDIQLNYDLSNDYDKDTIDFLFTNM